MSQQQREGFAEIIRQTMKEVIENSADYERRLETRLTREEASRRLRISLGTLDKRIKEGKIQVVRDGKRIFITESELVRQIFGE
jgi:excisionase family DNA binding protein